MPIVPWKAALLHVPTYSVAGATDRVEAGRMRLAQIDRLEARIDAVMEEERADLVVLPEFAVAHAEDNLYGVADGDGPEMDRLSAIAQKHGILLCAMLYVTDRRFPDRYFNASILFDDNGDVLARYYRLITNHASSPHDFWHHYLDVVGMDGVFPVARTRLGNLAMLSSMEMMYPEIARIYMLRGAETLLHLTSYASDAMAYMHRARAHENMLYFLSASAGDAAPSPGSHVASAIDWRGRPIGKAGSRDMHLSRATVDIEALRTGRSTPLHGDYVNLISRLRTEIMQGHYDGLSLFPVDAYGKAHDPAVKITPETHPEGIEAAIAHMRSAGILPPSSGGQEGHEA